MTVATATLTKVPNYVNGQWIDSKATEWLDVTNPATGEVIAQTPLSSAAEVGAAIEAAAAAFPEWRRTPAEDRIQPLFKLKHLLEEHIDDLARILTTENGKTFTEAKAELRRAIENVEVACGIPMMMQGYNLEDVARGIDEMMIRQPLGVVAAIVPFNFPGMIPFWFLPYAIATGNTFVLKPSERVPLTMQRAFELMENIGLPKGVVNLVNGGKNAVNALLDHPKVRAISFVGSTPVARYVYARAGEQWQARAMPGRREEPRHRVAGRRHEDDHADHRRQRLWLCRAALPGGFRGGDGWRSAEDLSRFDYRSGRVAARGQRSRRRRADGPGDHAAEQVASRDR